ncbi:MAG: diguanylate cyclase [Planctomycetota bacterium]|nr:diguanylate cyclase [Planctomycetota bacterium]
MTQGPKPVRLLLVDADPAGAALIAHTLEAHFGVGSVVNCPTLAKAMQVDLASIDLILSDMILPDGNGLDLIGRSIAIRPDLPVVLVARECIVAHAMAALRRGAYDYLVKSGDYLLTLPLTIEKNLAMWRTRRENHRLQEELTRSLEDVRVKNQQLEKAVSQLAEMAATDPLTGLANRRALSQTMGRAFADAQRHGRDLSCVMIDLDGFKLLNDSLGHQRGDDLLIAAATILQANSRRSDIVGRYGGDEFVLLLPEADRDTAGQVARRIASEFRTAAAGLFPSDPGNPIAPRITMSLGLASLRISAPANFDQLLAHADHALYRAKQLGRDRLEIYGVPVGGMPAGAPVAHPAYPSA